MSILSIDMRISPPVKALIVLFLLVLFAVGFYVPISRQQAMLAEEIAMSRDEYIETVDMAEQYAVLKKSTGQKQSVLLQEPLFSYVEKTTRALKLGKRIDYVRPENRTADDGSAIEIVHVSFKGIRLLEFVKYLYRIEIQKREISIQSISIKKDSKKNFDTQMTLQKRK